jgi:hypothetical protein
MGFALYIVRIPTRFIKIFLGANDASLYDVLYVLALSLILIAWIKNAPKTFLRPRYSQNDPANWMKRFNIPLFRLCLTHIGSAILMAAIFYMAGKFLF